MNDELERRLSDAASTLDAAIDSHSGRAATVASPPRASRAAPTASHGAVLSRRRLLVSAAAVAVVAAGAAAVPLARRLGEGDDSDADADAAVTTPTAAPTTTPPTTAAPTVPAAAFTHIDGSIARGSSGSSVKAMQERLTELAFDPGIIDGQFGGQTEAAVWAFQKLVMQTPRDQADGVVDDALWQIMQQPIDIQPRRPQPGTPNHTEVYLPEQVVAFFDGTEPVLVSHMSSGNGQEWREVVQIDVGEYGNEHGSAPIVRGEIGWSDTPGGIYSYDRFVEGTRDSALGSMWNPAYFNYGIAIHGALNVPLHPASHGCIRMPLKISETFHQFLTVGDEVYVWDGVKEPEVYGWDNPPRFNQVDHDWVPPPTVPPTAVTTTSTIV